MGMEAPHNGMLHGAIRTSFISNVTKPTHVTWRRAIYHIIVDGQHNNTTKVNYLSHPRTEIIT